jgi:hypothetical protein
MLRSADGCDRAVARGTGWVVPGLVAALVFAGVVGAGPVAGAAPVGVSETTEGGEQHCVIVVTDSDGDGVYESSPETCFVSENESARFAEVGVDLSIPVVDVAASDTGSEALVADTTIGLHYSAMNFTGSSVRIVGTTCGGGTWPATGSWDNNIESSQHYCGTKATTFFDTAACGGSSRSIYSAAGSLFEMNNRTSCVRYG